MFTHISEMIIGGGGGEGWVLITEVGWWNLAKSWKGGLF